MRKLHGQTCIVTGGAGAIGSASVLKFLAEGARVLVADINEKTGRETLARAAEMGYTDTVDFICTDVASESSVEFMCTEAVRRFGSLDIVFLSAGIGGAFGSIEQTWLEDWEKTLRVLLTGTFLCIRHAARIMRQQGRGGSIISMASVAANAAGFAPPAYSVAKAGVINLTRVAAVEFAPLCIRVNTISAGAVFGPLIERGFVRKLNEKIKHSQPWPECGQPEDIAAIAAFLASPESRFITGATIVADGGLTARGPSGLYSLINESSLGGLVGMDHGATGDPIVLRSRT